MIQTNLPLLHYTTATGLLGMFKDYTKEQPNIRLWATHYMYLNDPEEYELGKKICTEIIEQIEQELNVPTDCRVKTCIQDKEYLCEIDKYRKTSQGQLVNPYIISFSKVNDSLHMWDMYSSKGNGLALVFNCQKLLDAKILLKDCFYCNPNCENIIHCVSDKYKEDIIEIYQNTDKSNPLSMVEESMKSGDKIPALIRAYTIYTLICGHIGIRLKNLAYKIEQESRITVNGKEGFKLLFRDRNGTILPYIEYPIPFDCVDYILVGPTADFNLVRESILIFFDHKGVKNWNKNKILQSQIPYRL
ncbi:DUF2971 domain-containing protein [bacterium]|nr:DUF2971 domain-containing protein [bacterium]